MFSCTPIKSQTDIRNPLRYTALHMLLILTPLYKTNYIILCCIICNLNATSQLPLLFTHHYPARCFVMNMSKSRDIQAKIEKKLDSV